MVRVGARKILYESNVKVDDRQLTKICSTLEGAGTEEACWRCNFCKQSFKVQSSTQNFAKHIRDNTCCGGEKQKEIVELLSAALKVDVKPTALDKFVGAVNVSQEAREYLKIIDLVVFKHAPFCMAEDTMWRKHLGLEYPTTAKHIKAIIAEVVTAVHEKVRSEVRGKKIGLYFDGWSHGSVHYLSVFASYCVKKGKEVMRFLEITPLTDADLCEFEEVANANDVIQGG